MRLHKWAGRVGGICIPCGTSAGNTFFHPGAAALVEQCGCAALGDVGKISISCAVAFRTTNSGLLRIYQ